MPQSRSLRSVDFPVRSSTGCTDSVPLTWTQQARGETWRDKVPLKLGEYVPGAMSTESLPSRSPVLIIADMGSSISVAKRAQSLQTHGLKDCNWQAPGINA